MSERESFEAWFSEDGKYPHAVKRSGEGYLFAAANSQWEAWQARREALQEIKSAVGYGDRDAVEIFPAQKDLVNVANMRHLWIVPESIPFAWRKDGH